MGQRSEDFDIGLSCDCGFEEVVRVVTPLAEPVRRACPECGSTKLHARGLFPQSRDMIEEVDDFVNKAISSFKPLSSSLPTIARPSKSGQDDETSPANKRP